MKDKPQLRNALLSLAGVFIFAVLSFEVWPWFGLVAVAGAVMVYRYMSASMKRGEW